MYYAFGLMWLFSLLSCGSHHKMNNTITVQPTLETAAMRTSAYLPLLKGKRVACIVNQTSVIGKTHLVDSLLHHGIEVVKIFAPEHGFRGKADAGEHVNNEIDAKTGLPIVSMYGSKKKPSKEDLNGVDILLFDIQDVGVRFYTYISTLHYVMEACAENHLPLIVLDRPNPHAHYVDGPVLEKKYTSFIGMHPVPVVYGMTIGEYGRMINGESWLTSADTCKLTVIPCQHYKRESMYTLPIKPSPNLPNQLSIMLYPSLCFFEGSTMSLGRGTDRPFQVIGHKAITQGYAFTPQPNEGAKDPVFKGVLCHGEDYSTLDASAIHKQKKLDITPLIKYVEKFSTMNEKFFLDNLFFDKLAGNDTFRKQLLNHTSEELIRASWQKELDAFKKIRSQYLLYP